MSTGAKIIAGLHEAVAHAKGTEQRPDFLTIYDPPEGMLPPAPRGWESAPLPLPYTRAVAALVQCEEALEKAVSIEQLIGCEKGADALSSLFRQAKDKRLFERACRIKLWAIRKCGEVIVEFGHELVGRPCGVRGMSKSVGRKMAEDAGINEGQINRAVRIAKLKEDEFVAAVETSPPTPVYKLYEKGRPPRLSHPHADRLYVARIIRHLPVVVQTHEASEMADGLFTRGLVAGNAGVVLRACVEWLKLLADELDKRASQREEKV